MNFFQLGLQNTMFDPPLSKITPAILNIIAAFDGSKGA